MAQTTSFALNNLDLMEQLASELIGDIPNELLVKDLSAKLGLPYTDDSLKQLEQVLLNLESIYQSSADISSKKLKLPELEG
jgi:hypothetical protein